MMGKVFKYHFTISQSYASDIDENIEETEPFYYEVDYDIVQDAIADIIFKQYFSKMAMISDRRENVETCKNQIKEFIDDFMDWEDFYNNEDLNEDLKEYFEEEAFETMRGQR